MRVLCTTRPQAGSCRLGNLLHLAWRFSFASVCHIMLKWADLELSPLVSVFLKMAAKSISGRHSSASYVRPSSSLVAAPDMHPSGVQSAHHSRANSRQHQHHRHHHHHHHRRRSRGEDQGISFISGLNSKLHTALLWHIFLGPFDIGPGPKCVVFQKK